MLLKEIIIHGFKSFANRTKIELGPGVTTIVGPNGSGKSNVVDAIRWVLGEQSAKALRGGNMQDVIFSGTEKRPALGICEISLLFSDCEKQLGTTFNEVEIMRRVSRDGASNYFLNGKTCRLKDIQELFMNTGIGRVSYSFMVQGQIDQILSTNPAERRIIFEEAAGITRYKSQRNESLNKLEQVDFNLSRVGDIIDEVKRQIDSLKQQASKALRYKKIKHRKTHLDLALNAYNYQQHKTIIANLNEKVIGLKKVTDILTKKQEIEEEITLHKKSQQRQMHQNLQNKQQEIFDLRTQKDHLETQNRLTLLRKSDTEKRIEEIKEEFNIIKSQIEEFESKTKNDTYFKQLQLNLISTSDLSFKEKNQQVEQIQKKLLESEQDLQNKKRELLKTEEELIQLNLKNSKLEVMLNTNNNQIRDLCLKKEEEEASAQEITEQNQQLQKEFEVFSKTLEKEKAKFMEVQKKVIENTQVLKSIQKNIQEEDKQLIHLNAQMNALESLQSKFEGFSDGAKAILQGKLSILEKGDFELLSNSIEIEESYAKALETLLGPAIDAIALKEFRQIIDVTTQLEQQDLGRACLNIEIERESNKTQNNLLPEFLKPAGKYALIKDEKLKKRWDQLLEDCYFSDNLEIFLNYWHDNPDFNFQWVVTQLGELINYKGLIYGGSKYKKNEESGFLQRQSQIRKYRKKAQEQKKILDDLLEKEHKSQKEFHQSEGILKEINHEISKINEKIGQLNLEIKQGEILLERNKLSLNRIVEQIEQTKTKDAQSQTHLNEGLKMAQQLKEKVQDLKETITNNEEILTKIRQQRDDQREALSQIRIELAERKQKLQMLDHGLSENENRCKDLVLKYEQKQKDTHRLIDQISQFQNDTENYKIQGDQLEQSLREKRANLEIERKELLGIENAIKELDDKLANRRKELHEQESLLKDNELSLAQERSQVLYKVEKIKSEYDLELENLNWKDQLWLAQEELNLDIESDVLEELNNIEGLLINSKRSPKDPTQEDYAALDETDWTLIQKEVKTLRNRINDIGIINLAAIEEYVACNERYHFLQNQYNDLKSAKEELLKAIETINAITRELFKDTFEKVRQNFQFTFDALFGGGIADLQLIETEDFLEAGIEIIAKPPGSKLKGLSLLSGGQKTMTAVALLFAIYKVKPSPFCILDELDAPLDDANIGRFTNILREFTQYSQFLVISHNRRTIAASDTIYGVTMQEQGVTSLISIRFNKKDKEPADKVENFIEKKANAVTI